MGELNPADIAGAERPSIPVMLGRASLRHCPRCGAGGIFTGWWKMKEECPRCGLHFEGRPEEGHFLGAITINTGLTAGILLLGIWLYVIVLAVSDGLLLANLAAHGPHLGAHPGREEGPQGGQ